jgi:hypothetical protein
MSKKTIKSCLITASFAPYLLFAIPTRTPNLEQIAGEDVVFMDSQMCDKNYGLDEVLDVPEYSQNEFNLSEVADYIASHDGKRARVYCALNPRERNVFRFQQPTVGIGHYLESGHSHQVFQKAIPEVNWGDVRYGRTELTEDQINRLFQEDLQKHLIRAKAIFPDFDTYTLKQQMAISDGVYRGCLSSSPKTIQLIQEGDWAEASKEYLNHQEYRNSVRNGRSGVKYRMESASDLLNS